MCIQMSVVKICLRDDDIASVDWLYDDYFPPLWWFTLYRFLACFYR